MTTVSHALELELERHCTRGARVEVGTRYPWRSAATPAAVSRALERHCMGDARLELGVRHMAE